MTIQTFDIAMLQHHMVAIAVIAVCHLFHHCGQHGIDVGIMAVQVDAVMKPCAVKDGVGAVAVVGVDFEEVERQTNIQAVVQQLLHHTVLHVDEYRHVSLDGYLMSSGRC